MTNELMQQIFMYYLQCHLILHKKYNETELQYEYSSDSY